MIDVVRVSKRYRRGEPPSVYQMVRGLLDAEARGVHGGPSPSPPGATFLALRDVTFSVAPGEAVGLVGRNGAGKSTLLRILARITRPTTGHVRLCGRVAALLDAAAGFTADLSGRDNIYLYATLLRMSRAEIRRRFDEIVAFAGVERFLDVPVKHYSTGMQMRLAFAVTVHVDPEILLLDESVAVGDAEFQRQCLDRIASLAREGRTVVVVSHDMATLTRLCGRAILLEAGTVTLDGDAASVAAAREAGEAPWMDRTWHDAGGAPGDRLVRLRRVRARAEGGETPEAVDVTRGFGIELTFDVTEARHVLVAALRLYDAPGECVFSALEVDSEWYRRPRPAGRYVSTAWVPGHLLAEGVVRVGVAVYSLNPEARRLEEPSAIRLRLVAPPTGLTARGDFVGDLPGAVRPLLRWTVDRA